MARPFYQTIRGTLHDVRGLGIYAPMMMSVLAPLICRTIISSDHSKLINAIRTAGVGSGYTTQMIAHIRREKKRHSKKKIKKNRRRRR